MDMSKLDFLLLKCAKPWDKIPLYHLMELGLWLWCLTPRSTFQDYGTDRSYSQKTRY